MTAHKLPVPARQIVLAYVLLVSLVSAAWLVLAEPASKVYFESEEHNQALRSDILRLQIALKNDPAMDKSGTADRIDTLQSYIAENSLQARTIDIAGSHLQRKLTQGIERHRGKIRGTRILRNSNAAEVAVSIHFTVSLPGLRDLLFDLATTRPYVFVDLLSIQTPDRYLDSPAGADQPLTVQIDASVFWNEGS